MKRAAELMALARRQRFLLIQCMVDDLDSDGLTGALRTIIAAHDEFFRVLAVVCREESTLYDAAHGADSSHDDATTGQGPSSWQKSRRRTVTKH